MCYYTVTLDLASKNEGHTLALMILDAKDSTEATAKFLNTFGAKFYNDIVVKEGIQIEDGFDKLLSEHAKKYILKAKTKSSDASLISYQNMINLKDTL